ncbi:transmembrane protein 170A-like [Ptychodera flava]|uniref:transmembrane protein 170A-like n=1 Tax=Ptychodera flava TaxID=63121 RepID=UPI003969E789
MANQEDFTTRLDSFSSVIGLSSDPLQGFAEMWYHVFLWFLFSSVLVHAIAAFIAFFCLRKHKIGRFVPVAIIIMGFLGPMTGGSITSVAIAGVHRAAGYTMFPLYAMIFGVGQTLMVLLVSFTRILATM